MGTQESSWKIRLCQSNKGLERTGSRSCSGAGSQEWVTEEELARDEDLDEVQRADTGLQVLESFVTLRQWFPTGG